MNKFKFKFKFNSISNIIYYQGDRTFFIALYYKAHFHLAHQY